MSSAVLNTAGQILGLAGVLLLFVYGMPNRLRTGGGDVVTTNSTEEGKHTEALVLA